MTFLFARLIYRVVKLFKLVENAECKTLNAERKTLNANCICVKREAWSYFHDCRFTIHDCRLTTCPPKPWRRRIDHSPKTQSYEKNETFPPMHCTCIAAGAL